MNQLRQILLLALLFVSSAALSQINVKYFTSDYKPAPPDKAVITRQGIPESDKWHVFEFKQYDTAPFSEAWYLDSNFTVPDGSYTEYSDFKARKIMTRGQYAKGQKTGLWTSFFTSGKPLDSMQYADGRLGRSVTYYESGKMRTSDLLDVAGNGHSNGFREDGSTEHTGQFTQWKKSGEWTYYDLQGILCAKETMNADTIVSALFYDAAGKNPVTVTSDFERESDYPGGPSAWMRYISKSLSNANFPADYLSGKVYGTVVLTFVVDGTGAVTDVVVEKPIYPQLDQLAVKVIKNSSGKWIPARQHNRLVKSYKKQPVTFGQVR